jgi:hypothetical protein
MSQWTTEPGGVARPSAVPIASSAASCRFRSSIGRPSPTSVTSYPERGMRAQCAGSEDSGVPPAPASAVVRDPAPWYRGVLRGVPWRPAGLLEAGLDSCWVERTEQQLRARAVEDGIELEERGGDLQLARAVCASAVRRAVERLEVELEQQAWTLLCRDGVVVLEGWPSETVARLEAIAKDNARSLRVEYASHGGDVPDHVLVSVVKPKLCRLRRLERTRKRFARSCTSGLPSGTMKQPTHSRAA